MFSLISGIISSRKGVANKANKAEKINVEPEKTNTIHAFGLNRIVEEKTNVKQEFSKPIINEYSAETEIRKRNVHSEQSNRVYAFGCNRVIGNNSSQIKTSVFGFPFVK